MQILKCLLTVCVAVCTLSVYGGDTDAQIKAREALDKKLKDLQGQPSQPAPAKPAPAAPRPAPQAPVAVPPPAQAAPQAVSQTPADPEAIAKARQALEQKLNEMKAQPAQAAPAAPAPKPVVSQPPPPQPKAQPPVAPAPAAAPAAPTAAAPTAAAAAPAVVETPAAPGYTPTPAADPEAIAKAREALRQKMQTLGAQPPAAAPSTSAPPPAALPPGAPAVAITPVEPPATPGINSLPEADPAAINKARESVRTAMGMMPLEASTSPASKSGLNFPPLQGPPSGLSADKEQKLRGLLQQYKMDLISPEQYQAARAKILAGP